jgi:hypothetical protein
MDKIAFMDVSHYYQVLKTLIDKKIIFSIEALLAQNQFINIESLLAKWL